jgi:osmoprotectant transport system permease protein
MSLFSDALDWFTDTGHWAGTSGIPSRLLEHLELTALTLLVAGAIALPLGVLIGHTRRGTGVVGAATGAARALPTLGLLTLFGLLLGIGLTAPFLALVVLALPSLLAGAYAGVQSIPPDVPAAARALGMTPGQVVLQVEIPLALPVIIGGIRAATLQVVSTTTLAAYTADAGLGRYLFVGLKTRDYPQMLRGALLVLALALLQIALGAVQRGATRRWTRPTSRPSRTRRLAH